VEDDDGLEEILRRYVKEGLRSEEIIDFVSRDFSQYAWTWGRWKEGCTIFKSVTLIEM